MRLPPALLLLCLGAALLGAAEPGPDDVVVPPLKASIYVASVTLTPGVFERQGDSYTAAYEVEVWPWRFWDETGRVTIHLSAGDLARVRAGQPVDFRGEGRNAKNKPRKVTGQVQPSSPHTGRIKLRISADGYSLTFNSTYRFAQ